MSKSRRWLCLLVLSVLTLLATGCVFGPKEDVGTDEVGIDPPQIDYTANQPGDIVLEIGEADSFEAEESLTETPREVEREIYVFNHQGYVVPITVKVPYTESVAKQALEYLVVDGPVTPHLPEGTRAVLPAGTEVEVNITESGTAIVDFSNEFATYAPEDEQGILEAITWTLTQFDTINDVVIWINGHPQDTMPVNHTPIAKKLSRKDGINVEVARGTHVTSSSSVTLYFKGESPSGTFDYYVPVTRLIPKSDNLVLATVEELIHGPEYGSGLYTDFLRSTEILEASLSGQRAVVNFDEQFLRFSGDEMKASDSAVDSLVLSLTELDTVKEVQVLVNGESNLITFNGKDLSKPVTRSFKLNTTGF